jgi:protein SCO1
MNTWRAIVAVWTCALAAAAGPPGAALAQHAHAPAMARTQLASATPDTVLMDQDGRHFSFAQARGKPVLIAFIYTSCHHVCPLIFDSVSAVQTRAKLQGEAGLAAIFVTVDPEIDTPEILKTYALRRGADLSNSLFLTGRDDELRSVWDAFGVKVKRIARGLIDHPPLTYLADAKGVVRYRYLGGVLDTEAVLADLHSLQRIALKD